MPPLLKPAGLPRPGMSPNMGSTPSVTPPIPGGSGGTMLRAGVPNAGAMIGGPGAAGMKQSGVTGPSPINAMMGGGGPGAPAPSAGGFAGGSPKMDGGGQQAPAPGGGMPFTQPKIGPGGGIPPSGSGSLPYMGDGGPPGSPGDHMKANMPPGGGGGAVDGGGGSAPGFYGGGRTGGGGIFGGGTSGMGNGPRGAIGQKMQGLAQQAFGASAGLRQYGNNATASALNAMFGGKSGNGGYTGQGLGASMGGAPLGGMAGGPQGGRGNGGFIPVRGGGRGGPGQGVNPRGDNMGKLPASGDAAGLSKDDQTSADKKVPKVNAAGGSGMYGPQADGSYVKPPSILGNKADADGNYATGTNPPGTGTSNPPPANRPQDGTGGIVNNPVAAMMGPRATTATADDRYDQTASDGMNPYGADYAPDGPLQVDASGDPITGEGTADTGGGDIQPNGTGTQGANSGGPGTGTYGGPNSGGPGQGINPGSTGSGTGVSPGGGGGGGGGQPGQGTGTGIPAGGTPGSGYVPGGAGGAWPPDSGGGPAGGGPNTGPQKDPGYVVPTGPGQTPPPNQPPSGGPTAIGGGLGNGTSLGGYYGQGGGGAQNLGTSGSGSGGGTNESQNTSHGDSSGQSTNTSTSTGTTDAQNTSNASGTSFSDAKQTYDVTKVGDLLGAMLGREGAAANPYTRQQFAEQGNRDNARVAAGAQSQIDSLLARVRANGGNPNDPSVQAQIQKIQQQRGAAELENSSKQDAAFRQAEGQFDQANAGQAVTQRGQDVSQRQQLQNLISALFGQTTSNSQNQSTAQGTSTGRTAANAQGQSTQQSVNDAYGYSKGQNWFQSQNLPIIGIG